MIRVKQNKQNMIGIGYLVNFICCVFPFKSTSIYVCINETKKNQTLCTTNVNKEHLLYLFQ